MNIPDEHHAGTPENGQPAQPADAAVPERHTDWISYAVSVAQQPQTTSHNAH